MSIPRKIPTNIIRKPVHTSDAGYKEIAIMGTLILVLNVLGVCLYWLVNKNCFGFALLRFVIS